MNHKAAPEPIRTGTGTMADPTSADERRRSLQPLRRVFPYIARYRGLVVGAAISLVLAAVTTLALPLAVVRCPKPGQSSVSSTPGW